MDNDVEFNWSPWDEIEMIGEYTKHRFMLSLQNDPGANRTWDELFFRISHGRDKTAVDWVVEGMIQ